ALPISLFSGPLALGLVLGLVGFIVIRKGISGISETKLAPEKALETLTGEPVGVNTGKNPEKKKQSETPKPDSDAIQTKAEKTRDHLESTMKEIKFRLSPSHIRDTVVLKVKQNPLPTAALTVGSLAGIWFMRRHRKAARLAGRAC
ncbi:MAG: hypothetical protein JWM99_1702, partial [Verrucomicrobiales bacterium]|nr:hypothetical protein [Verrucomicrobiales bacterium]